MSSYITDGEMERVKLQMVRALDAFGMQGPQRQVKLVYAQPLVNYPARKGYYIKCLQNYRTWCGSLLQNMQCTNGVKLTSEFMKKKKKNSGFWVVKHSSPYPKSGFDLISLCQFARNEGIVFI